MRGGADVAGASVETDTRGARPGALGESSRADWRTDPVPSAYPRPGDRTLAAVGLDARRRPPVRAPDPRPRRARSSGVPAPAGGPTSRSSPPLRRDLGGPRVLAFANPKGGVHKTTATVLGAATIGSVRGRGVVAWDDNELRGTLGPAGRQRPARPHHPAPGRRAGRGRVARRRPALAERLDDFLRHASDGSYDVLAGEEDPRFARRLDPQTVRRVLELLRRTHDVICVDTGNNVESANWQTVMQTADQLVITSVPREDAAFTADWMLDLLDEAGMGELVANAVTLLSCPTPAAVADGRRPRPALRAPGPGRSSSCPTTRRWRRARRSSTGCSSRRPGRRGSRRPGSCCAVRPLSADRSPRPVAGVTGSPR